MSTPGLSLLSLLFLITLSWVRPAAADQLLLSNGDRLTGVVTGMVDGKITLETGYSNPIVVETAEIKAIFTERDLEVHLVNSSIRKARLTTTDQGTLLLLPSTGSEALPVTWQDISSINPPPKKWSTSITVGADVQSGNTERGSGSVEAEVKWKGDTDRLGARFLFNYAQEDGKLTARNSYGGLNHDHFFDGKLYAHLGLELLSDEFRDLNLRTVVGPAVGYQLWDQKERSLGVELGVTYFIEDHKEDKDTRWATGRAAATLSWQILTGITFTDRIVTYPGIQRLGEYQLRNEAGITSAIRPGWSLRLSNIIEFDSNPATDVKKTDLFWILGLQHTF